MILIIFYQFAKSENILNINAQTPHWKQYLAWKLVHWLTYSTRIIVHLKYLFSIIIRVGSR